MTYEKVQELKNAGFPMPTEGKIWCVTKIHGKHEEDLASTTPYIQLPEDGIFVPTLQELIHAVKADHKLVEMITDKNGNDKWCAQASNLHPRWIETVMYFDTPEEAVANLWLTLHNK